jgi:hypothetical protein
MPYEQKLSQIRPLKMARTRYGLLGYAVTGLRGRTLKKFYTKVTSNALSPRNPQRATRNELHHQYLKLGGGFGYLIELLNNLYYNKPLWRFKE